MSHNPFIKQSSEVATHFCQAFSHLFTPPQASEDDSGRELLVTYISANGGEQCAVVKMGDSYEEMLEESCPSLAPWLPPDWKDRHRYFAQEVQSSRGDAVWAVIQPSLVTELVRWGRLPELRLMILTPTDYERRSILDNLSLPNEQSPAYEARPQHTVVDGIVQAVLHRLYSEDAVPRPDSAFDAPMSQGTKDQSQRLDEALASESQMSQSHNTSKVLMANPVTSNIGEPGSGKPSRQAPSTSDARPHVQEFGFPLPPPDQLGKSTSTIERTLQVSFKLVSEDKYEAAIRVLRSAYHATSSAQERAQFFLWLGEIGYEIMEYTNAGCDIAIARDLFIALEDRAGRIECDIILARIAHKRAEESQDDTALTRLLAEARRHGLAALEVQLLCEICRMGCSEAGLREDSFLPVNQAKAGAQRLGDPRLRAESLRTAGLVDEAEGDYLSALQAYSTALEFYRDAKVQSPLSPIKRVETDIQRVKAALSKMPDKPKSRLRRFF
ncbi:unnamed protein product [Rhizoctonia solani]|uniref:Tetratricopeptide repeat protein n=1 Tax=Rhizoctonia solani TaxID=456999 RepID=A0A8H3GUD3_9AGAM|nr:unnamed protein product [Rhizoctonia solani]